MSRDLIDAVTTPASDSQFGKKFVLTSIGLLLTFTIVGIPLVLSYLLQTLQHSRAGKKGLPDWNYSIGSILQGGVCLLAVLYALPGALAMALAILPKMANTKDSMFSLGGMLSNFIIFGGLILALAGLAFSLAGICAYLDSDNLGDIFNAPKLLIEVKKHSADLIALQALVGIIISACWLLTLFAPGFTFLVPLFSLLSVSYLGLVVAVRTGVIFPPLKAIELSDTDEPASSHEPQEARFEETTDDDIWTPK